MDFRELDKETIKIEQVNCSVVSSFDPVAISTMDFARLFMSVGNFVLFGM